MGKVRVEKKSRSHASIGAGAASQVAVHRASAGGGSSGGSGGGNIRQDISFNKDFGQHILKNPLVVKGIVEKVVPVPVCACAAVVVLGGWGLGKGGGREEG